jgi:peptide/nickel transport system permease protein
MRAYAIRRLALFVPTIILATMLVFTLFWIVPGDAAYMLLTGGDDDAGKVSLEQLDKLREELGLNQPVHIQYGLWVWDILRGDLGTSIWYNIPVWEELESRFYVTIELAVISILMAIVVAIPLGVISAVKQDSWGDYSSRVFTLIGIALPTFWFAILMVYALVYFVNWLPPLGYAKLWADPWTNLQQMFFPALCLAFNDLAFTARVTRSTMLEVMREDYMRTARAKGLKELAVIGRHALRNALLPVVTISGYQFAGMLGGVIIVESIFVVPGMGSLLIDSIIHRDFVALQAIVLIIAAVTLTVNLVIDLTYGFLDPRIRYR